MGSGIYVALGVVAIHGLGLTPVALVVGGLVVATVAAGYAEGVSLFPEAGGSAALARHAFNELASFVTGWAMCLALIATAALSAVFAARYLSVFWSPLASGRWSVVGGVVVIALVAAACVRGLELSASLAVFAGILDLVVQLLLVLLGSVFVFRPEVIQQNVHFGTAPTLTQVILACALAMVAYTGIESIGDMAAEARDPDRDLAWASAGVLASAITLSAAISLVALMAAPASRTASGAYTALAIVSQVPLHVLSTGLAYFVGLLVAAMLVLVAHAAVRSCSRLAFWQTQHHQLPARTAALHPAYETPHVAIAASGAAAALLVAVHGAVGDASFLAGTYVYGALLAFTSVHVSVIALRWRDPGRYRPVEAPVNLSIDGRRIPGIAILGAVCTASAWVAVVLLERDARYLGSAWMLVGLAWYAAYRARLGLSLSERTRREVVTRTGPGIAVEFQTMLIPVNTAAASIPTDLVEVAAQLAAERRASLVLLAFTEIPLGEEMDMDIDDLEEVVKRLAATGRAIGEQYGIRVLTTHLRSRDPAESILAEATRRNSQLILVRAAGLQRADVRRVAYDHVVRRIIAEARQRVMIVRPKEVRT
jgi:APA family basic amino acid/polyamine antiporter